MTAKRVVVDLASPRASWRIPPARVSDIGAALGKQWELIEIRTPASSDGDGASGSGSREAIAAAAGAEIYIGYGIAAGVAAAGKPTLRWVHSGTAGIGSSITHLRGTGIQLTNSAGVHAEPMADWVIASIAYFARGLDRMATAQREGRWAKEEFADHADTLPELRDVRVGILGLGGIGNAVARRAVGLGMPVAGVRRHPQRGGPQGVRWVGALNDLARLAAESDCLVIAAPHTPETAGAVDGAVLERLPAHALVVNVSRGSLLDETALLALLDSGHLAGAALDVFATEPLPPGHRFWTHPRVLMSPHVSAVTSRFWERETALIVDNIKRYLAGAPLTNLVDLEAGY
jgi:phosphoglycerate dehydrogenase-like enzyme